MALPNNGSKGTDNFKKVIETQLDKIAMQDELFAKTLQKEGKNIDDCIIYILNEVKNSGCNGFTDDEIFNMAIHYYDEDNIDIGKKSITAQAVVNHKIELTEDDLKEAKAKAMEKAIAEAKDKITKKKAPEKPKDIIGPQEKPQNIQGTLDF